MRIVDVAAAAGVSPTTVSHALNGRGQLNPKTRDHVTAVAAELGYRPSRAARTLRTSRTEALGLVLPSFEAEMALSHGTFTGDHYVQLIRGATLTAFAAGFRLLIAPPLSSASEAGDLGVDGVLICDPADHDRQLRYLDDVGLPFVTYERIPDRPEHRMYVTADNAFNIRRLLDHLVERGASRIAFMVPDLATPVIDECARAYLDWCEEEGSDPLLELIDNPSDSEVAGRVDQVLKASSPPDAILHILLPSVLRACKERGLRIPGDLLVASYGDTSDTRTADPPITAIDGNPTLVGEQAIRLLVDLVEGKSPAGPIVIPAPMHVRASTSRKP